MYEIRDSCCGPKMADWLTELKGKQFKTVEEIEVAVQEANNKRSPIDRKYEIIRVEMMDEKPKYPRIRNIGAITRQIAIPPIGPRGEQSMGYREPAYSIGLIFLVL